MLPDQGCYEERYRLTVPVLRGFALSFAPLIVAIFSHQRLPWLVLSPPPSSWPPCPGSSP
jgi:hypothetical protein